MRKYYHTFAGLAAGLIIVLFVDVIVQAAAASMLLSQPINLSLQGIRLAAEFNYSADSFIRNILVAAAPLVSSIIFIELGIMALISKKTESFRIIFVVFILVNTGYLIYSLVTGVIAALTDSSIQHDLTSLLKNSEYSYNQQLIFMLLFAILLLAYVNIILKRMRRYLPSVVENKKNRKA